MRYPRITFLSVLLGGILSTLWSSGTIASGGVEQTGAWIPMRDGVRLAANLFRSAQAGRLPTILVRTPYDKNKPFSLNYGTFAANGFNVVVQDVRGTFESEGVFSPLSQEGPDGEDTLNWIAEQSWSDGKVGMTGASYLGIAQWKVVVHNNPHLKAIFPVVAGDDDYRDRFYSPGGAMKWGHRLEWVAENMRTPGFQTPDFRDFVWTLPMRHVDQVITGQTTGLMQEAFNHPSYDKYWKSVSTRERLKDCRTPVFSVGGWYDNYVESDLDAFSIVRRASGLNRILIGPWAHSFNTPFKTVDYGPTASISIRHLQNEWFEQWLKGKDVPAISTPPLRIFVMGTNVWRDENEWPLARAIPTKFYLSSGGHANTETGDGLLTDQARSKSLPDHFVYDPKKPVQTMGGAVCCNVTVFPWGPLDQRPVEKRNDVLVFSTPVLKEDLEVTGPISLTLEAATTARDTDFTGKLVDVYPDGRAINLTDGLQRARYRTGLDKPKLLDSTGPVEYTIDLGVTSNVFRKGHRIRLEVSSSNFPRFDRNPNTGRVIADETQLIKANQTLYHDRARRSYLNLPVIPPVLPVHTVH